MNQENKRRNASRNACKAVIVCRPFISSWGANYTKDAIMQNFSEDGVYIESSHDFRIGELLHLRIVGYPTTHQPILHKKQPRSNCLAEVKWRHEKVELSVRRYGLGLKYIGNE
jgi:hypothetical protein